MICRPQGPSPTFDHISDPFDVLAISLSDHALVHLRWRVLNGEFVSGDKIRELTLSKEMDVSRATVREATRRLSGSGLLEIDTQRGVFVRAYSISQIEDIIDIRRALCSLTASLFIERATEHDRTQITALYSQILQTTEQNYQPEDYACALAFNEAVVRAAHNERLFSLYHESWQQVRVFKLHLLKQLSDTLDVPAYNRSLFFQGKQQRNQLMMAIAQGQASQIDASMRSSADSSLARARDMHETHLEATKTTWREKIVSARSPVGAS